MAGERIDPEFKEVVVTYSRVPTRERGADRDMVDSGRREPMLDAEEIPVLDARDDGDLAFAVRSERRGEAVDDVAGEVDDVDLGLDERRSPIARYIFATAGLAFVGGVGVLAATFGFATLAPNSAPIEAQSTISTPPVLAAADPKDVAPASDIREIPLATQVDDKTATGPVMVNAAPEDVPPPVPRARPELTTASVASKAEPVKAEAPARPAVATLDSPRLNPPQTVPTLPPPAPAARTASAPAGGTDALISSIEETLAKRDVAPSQQGTIDPHGAVMSSGGPVPVLPPPASMAPGYPSPDSAYPSASAQGQTYDVLPPAPVTDNGYGSGGYGNGNGGYGNDAYPAEAAPRDVFPRGPVPPESVPYGYPSQPMGYEVIPEKEPGLLRRTWMRTADAVSRVFSRDH